jgi:hypothetical protein
MSRLSIVGATALSLVLAVGTPTFAAEPHGVHGGGAMHVRSGGLGGAQAKRWHRGIEKASALYCAQSWGRYYNPASGKYMGDDGEWRPCR